MLLQGFSRAIPGSTLKPVVILMCLFIPYMLSAQVPERAFYITADGDDDCSDNHCGFQAALDSAAIDSAHITFLLAEGVYPGEYSFIPDSGDCYGDIIIEGGWNLDFSERNMIHKSIIDGEGERGGLDIRKYKSERPGGISVDDLKIINCKSITSGGGMLLQTYGDYITVSNCIIMNNQAWSSDGTGGRNGGGVYSYSFNPETNKGGKIIYSNNYIDANTAGANAAYGQGGGIFSYVADTFLVMNNIIVNNEALGDPGVGGGIEVYCKGGEILFANNVFSGNYAYNSGGGTANHTTTPISASNWLYINNIIYGNSKGGGFGYGIDAYTGTNVVDGMPVTIAYHHNLIGYHSKYPSSVTPTYTDNLSEDPKFIDTLYRLAPSSPAIDSGFNDCDHLLDFDFLGQKRIQYGQIDMGAHEHDGIVAYYKLDGDAVDASINHIDGEFYSSKGNGLMDIEEMAAHIVNDTQRILIPHDDELNIPEEITLSFWVNADSLNTVSHLLSKSYTCNHNGNYHVYLGKGGGLSTDFDRPTFSYYDGTGSTKMYVCDDTIRKEEWNHIVVCYNFSTYDIQLYLNGNAASGSWYNGDEPAGDPVMVSYPLGIGASITSEDGCNGYQAGEGQYPFFGRIDEVKIYNQILDPDMILEDYSMPPYAISLSPGMFNENLPTGFEASSLVVSDPNIVDGHVFELVEGEGDDHNGLFSIDGDILRVETQINYEVRPDCNIRVKVNDRTGNELIVPLNLEVLDMNDIPVVATPLVDQNLVEGTAWSYIFDEATFADEDTWDHLTYSAELNDESALPVWMQFTDASREFAGTPDAVGAFTVVVSATDDSARTVTDDFLVQIDPNSVKDEVTAAFKIYPQPVENWLFVESQIDIPEKIVIINITGARVIEKELNASVENILNVAHLESGVYFYRVITSRNEYLGKFIKE